MIEQGKGSWSSQRRWLMSVAVLASAACARPDITSAELPLRRVVIHRNGVGYFERAGRVDSDRVTFKMRQRRVGDFLATLAIVERGGSSGNAAQPEGHRKESAGCRLRQTLTKRLGEVTTPFDQITKR
jgi:hypothetical protein